MTTKMDATGVEINWDAVARATEIHRTYLVTNQENRQFFKMYKPSEAKDIFKSKGWTGRIVNHMDSWFD